MEGESMDQQYVSLLSGLVGALVGAGASVAGIYLQSKYQARRELTQTAVTIALEDWKLRWGAVREQGGVALPLSAFIHYHTRLLDYVVAGRLNADAIRELSAEEDALIRAIHEVREAARQRRQEG
jgi:hypothetical protein